MKYFKPFLITIILLLSAQVKSQLIWEVSSKKQAHKSYILGTHPLIPATAFDSTIQIYKIFNKADIIVSTYDNYSIDANSFLKKMAILPLNKTIKDFMTDSTYADIDLELRKVLKLNIKELGRLHPLFIRDMYLNELFAQSIKIKDDIQSDSYFQSVANTKGQKVIGIENYELHLTELLNVNDVKQNTILFSKDILKASSQQQVFVDFYQAYCNSDLKKIETLIKNHPYLSLSLKSEKSVSDLPKKLVSLLQSNRCLYIVNVSQLVGSNTLINKLKKEGFELKPL